MEKKTECEIVQDLLFGYVDNVLNQESKKLVEKHLVECSNCRERLKEIENDAKNNENNQKKQIDYLKKVRIKNKIKSVLFVICIIVLIFLGLYIYKFSILNSISNKASKQFENGNYYIEKISKEGFAEDKLFVDKTWYKDGKYKNICCSRNDADGSEEIIYTKYANENSKEEYVINGEEKKVEKRTWWFDKNLDNITNLPNPIHPSFRKGYMILRLGTPFHVKISTSYREIGRKYYILEEDSVITWVDMDTGLPIMRFGDGIITTYFNNTKIPKQREESISEYHYEFNKVTDEDVKVPDFADYEIEEINYNEQIENKIK